MPTTSGAMRCPFEVLELSLAAAEHFVGNRKISALEDFRALEEEHDINQIVKLYMELGGVLLGENSGTNTGNHISLKEQQKSSSAYSTSTTCT